jgi:putative flippase GtrA
MIGAFRRHGSRAARFAVVGVLNTAIDFGVFIVLLYALSWPLLLANTIGYAAGLANSYLLNSRWTFRDAERPSSPGRAARYAGLNLVGLLLANATVWLLAQMLAPWLAKCGALGVTFIWNYWSAQRFVFGRSGRFELGARPPA